uniref:Uncharacterized protein n=1 Tax=Acrobeloides nanus TaxID=290746 RepID=A0A914ER01_9BILA
MFYGLISACARQFCGSGLVRHFSNQCPRFLSARIAPISYVNVQSKGFCSSSNEKKFNVLSQKATFKFGAKRYFLNLVENTEDKALFFTISETFGNRKISIFLEPNIAKQLLDKLKEVKKFFDQGDSRSNCDGFAYVANFLAKRQSKNGEKNMEYSVKLKTKSEKYMDNIFYIVARNLDDDTANVISMRDDGIETFITALEGLLVAGKCIS